MKSIVFLITACFFSFTANAGKVEDYLTKINANYADLSAIQLPLNYQLYRGINGTKVEDEYSSSVYYKGALSYRKMQQEEMITTAEKTLVINHDLRTIQVMPTMEQNIFDLDVETSIKECRDIQLREMSSGHKQIKMLFKEVSTVPFAAIQIEVDENFWVKKIIYYHAEQLNFSRDYFHPDYAFPRLEVTFGDLKKEWKNAPEMTNISKYLTFDGTNYHPSELYANYEIIQY